MRIEVQNPNGYILYEFDSKTHLAIFNGDSPLCIIFKKETGVTYTPKKSKKPITITYQPDAQNHDEFNALFLDYVREKCKTLAIKAFTN